MRKGPPAFTDYLGGGDLCVVATGAIERGGTENATNSVLLAECARRAKTHQVATGMQNFPREMSFAAGDNCAEQNTDLYAPNAVPRHSGASWAEHQRCVLSLIQAATADCTWPGVNPPFLCAAADEKNCVPFGEYC